MPEKVRDLATITEQKLEGNLEASLIPSRKESLGIMTDSGETRSQAFNAETQTGGHICQRLQGPWASLSPDPKPLPAAHPLLLVTDSIVDTKY